MIVDHFFWQKKGTCLVIPFQQMIFVKPNNFSQVWHLIVMNCQIFEVEMKETPNVGNIFVPWILSERTL